MTKRKEQPERRIYSAPGAMRKTGGSPRNSKSFEGWQYRRFVLLASEAQRYLAEVPARACVTKLTAA